MSESSPRQRPTYETVNRGGWEHLARNGCDSSQPYGARQLGRAKALLDGAGWIPWKEVRHVLCLAAAGGQQAPLFASMGCRVVSADLSPEQLQRDRQVARKFSLDIECVEADMLHLDALHGRDFDLVYQAISACYVPAVRQLYREIARVTRPGGYYFVEHWNPVHLQLSATTPWNGESYQVTRPLDATNPIPWVVDSNSGEGAAACWHYMHSLSDLIGGVCDAGFQVIRFGERQYGNSSAEPGSDAHLAAYLPPFFSMLSKRE